MIYLFVSAISLVMMVVVYRLSLSRTTFHSFNRFVLLVSLGLAAIMPLMHFQRVSGVASAPVSYVLNEMTVYADGTVGAAVPESSNGMSMLSLFTLVYLAGVIICLLRVAIGIMSSEIICHRRSRMLSDGSHLVITDRNYAPFSWRNYIVISRKDYEAGGAMIIAHEQAHVRHHHSIDLILAQLFCAFQWFNPAAWMLKRSLLEVHEFEADASVLDSGFDERRYQICLVRAALQGSFATTTNNFANCSTKKRIVMMNRHSTNPWARLRVLLMLPVVALAVIIASACQNDEKDSSGLQNEPTSDVVFEILKASELESGVDGNLSMDGKVVIDGVIVDEENAEMVKDLIASGQMQLDSSPEFPGGTMALLQYLASNINYPQECREQKIQGRVLVTFIVNKEGSLESLEVVKSVHPALDAEALRVISAMPAWKPGTQWGKPVRVKYTLPVNFRLREEAAQE